MPSQNDETPEEIIRRINATIENYDGNSNQLEQAIGAWFVARRFGWKVFFLMHDRKTIARHQKILGADFQAEFDDVGDLAAKSIAWTAFGKLKSFWKAVKGEIPGIKSPEIS